MIKWLSVLVLWVTVHATHDDLRQALDTIQHHMGTDHTY